MIARPVLKLGTVMLGVRDMERSVAFYRDAVGLDVQFSAEAFTFLDGRGVTLALRQTPDLRDSGDDRRVELVFHVEDIDASRRELGERGVAFFIEPRIVTGDQLAGVFRDPDGHILSILGRRAAGKAVAS
jgi:catechol 2,3-dioxygenase-like lactoylglutathione lyase family enzyme